ncbi:unnamed protein product [Orchesella dallaii]|uniref:GAF domain-containing protein n=1 Tax=Orchesella dallaii TaxID=48710 RepID=A0ABP1QMX5_9HEXA
MFGFSFDPNLSKEEFYKELTKTLRALVSGQRDLITNLANASSLIYHALNSLNAFKTKPVNWAGFYLTAKDNASLLRLGPFQGKVACTEIKFGRGVCGAAASTGKTQVVPNVHDFPGHIACDSSSVSEIVVPIVSPASGRVLGVLDIDDEGPEAFGEADKAGLETVVQILLESCDWTE